MNSRINSNLAKLTLESFMILILLLDLVGCAVNINNSRRHVKGYPIRADRQAHRLKPAATENNKAMDWFKENEWQYNKGDKTQPPKQCLALSGGGIRSAAFGIGVLKGLHEKGVLDRIDIISGVSGGSFALSWYYFQQYGESLNGFSTNDPSADSYSEARAYYGENLVDYYLQSKMNNKCGKLLFDCEFPQYTTMDQSYTPEQFEAYVDLGYHIVKNET